MKHFGIAFGAITATVVGGALLLDLTTNAPEKTASRLATPPAGVTEPTTSPASVASTNGAGEASAMVADARAVDEAPSRKPASVSPQESSGKTMRSPPKRRSSVDPAPSTGEQSTNSNTAAGDKPGVEQPESSGTEPPTAPPTTSSANSATASSASVKEDPQSEVASTTK